MRRAREDNSSDDSRFGVGDGDETETTRGRRAVEVVARASDDREVAARIVETEAARMFDDETADAKPLRARRAR